MESQKGVGFLSYYTTDVVADSIQFLEPRTGSTGAAAPQYGGQTYGNDYGPAGGSTYQQNQPPVNKPNYEFSQDPFSKSKGPLGEVEDDLPF